MFETEKVSHHKNHLHDMMEGKGLTAMKAWVISKVSDMKKERSPLEKLDLPVPIPVEDEILVRVTACGVCHTEIDEIEGRTPPAAFPVIPGHQIVGRVEKRGGKAKRFTPGDRVGVAWVYSTCGKCQFCTEGRENLCASFMATGRDAHGGYAEYTLVRETYAFAIPAIFSDSEAAPLLCAGAIGYRSLRLAGIEDGENIGLTGFGASAHMVIRMICHNYPRSKVFVFSRTAQERAFARELGAVWAGDTAEESPEKIRSIIDTTPAWKPAVAALRNLERGGRLVINAIRKEDADKDELRGLDYSRDLWMEKEVRSVANITRRDVAEFLGLASQMRLKPEIQEFPLEDANRVLLEIKEGKIRGAKVLKVS
jgi:propanol-preferring alcohol dehydrogenase